MNVKTPNRAILKSKVSELLTFFKETNNITYTQLAEMLNTTYLQVHRWCSEQTLPDPDSLEAICAILGVEKTTLVSTATSTADKIDISSIVKHYALKASDNEAQRKYIILAAGLVYEYLAVKQVNPVLLLQVGSGTVWSLPADPDMHEIHAMYTCDGIDNMVLFGSSSDIKFQFLSSDTSLPVLSLTTDNLITAVSTQLIHKELHT